MRVFIAALILIFSLQSWTKADDIRDFEIEGISVWDSLLNYMTQTEINNFEKTYYSGSKKYVRLQNNISLNENLKIFDKLSFEVLNNDKKYVVHAVNGTLTYKNNVKDCYAKMEEILNDLTITLGKPITRSYEYKYPNGRGKSKVSDFDYSNGSIRIWCTDYSQKAEKNRYHDHLGLVVQTLDHVYWIKNKAHK